MQRLTAFFVGLCLSSCVLALDIQHWVTPAGARVYFVETRALPIVDVQIDFAAGSMFDPADKAGTAALTRAVLDLGAGDLDENAVADRLADLGARLGGSADTDRASVSLRTLSAAGQRDAALEVFYAILHAPRFDAEVFAREKQRTVASLKEALTRPDTLAGRAFWSALYPAHPYGRQAMPDGVAALSRDDIVAHYQHYYVAAGAAITLVGDLSRADAERIAERLAAGLPAGEAPALPAPPVAPRGGLHKVAHPASQAHIYLGLPAIERGHPDFFPLLVGNYTLGGGGFVSRLVKEVRDKRGFAYSVYSYFAPLRQPGPFQIGLQTRRSQARDAIKVVRQVLDTFVAQGPSADELAAAKANLTGSFPLRLDSNKKLLDNVAVIGFYGLPLDYLDTYRDKVAAVTAEDIRAAFARQVKAGGLVTVTVAAD